MSNYRSSANLLAETCRNSYSKRTLLSKRIFANLGFLLQIAGLLTVLPIGIGLILNEAQTLIPLLITCVSFLGVGFLCNSLCERKDLDFKSANILFVIELHPPAINRFCALLLQRPLPQP